MKDNIRSIIEISGLELQLSIGWGELERKSPQPIRIDVIIRLTMLPKACITDELSDTICYDGLVVEIKRYSQLDTHRLLEHFSEGLYRCIKGYISVENRLWLRVSKMNPPIEGVGQGVSFTLEDE